MSGSGRDLVPTLSVETIEALANFAEGDQFSSYPITGPDINLSDIAGLQLAVDGANDELDVDTQLDTGTVTASGGSTPAVDTTLANVGISETDAHDFVVYVDADPAFNADYAFNYEWGFQWDQSQGQVDINLTVNWDTDPGGGNDVTLRWEVVAP